MSNVLAYTIVGLLASLTVTATAVVSIPSAFAGTGTGEHTNPQGHCAGNPHDNEKNLFPTPSEIQPNGNPHDFQSGNPHDCAKT
jgi:hypothetical protein